MAVSKQSFEIETERNPPLWDRLLGPMFLLLAWVAFELTANATLSVVLACLKFGTNDFRAACWLWQVDPHRPRARACATFYLASGIWKTSIVPLFIGGGVAIAWAMVAPQAMQRAPVVTKQLFLALTVGMWAAGILVFLAGGAALLSLAARWRIWVHPNLHRCRKEAIWPPRFEPTDYPLSNQASLIILTAIFAAVLLGPVLTLLTLKLLEFPAPVHRAMELLIIFGYPIFGAFAFGYLRSKLFARTPWECWPESIRELSVDVVPVDVVPVGEVPSTGTIR